MFLFKASSFLAELKAHSPDIFAACERAISDTSTDLDFIRIDREPFVACPDDSIDYAVMEKTKDAVVVPMNAGWNDIGSWSSLWDVSEKDEAGNAVSGDVMLLDSKNSFVRSDDKLVTGMGLHDIVIVSTKDATLVAHKDRVQDAKLIAFKLKTEGRDEWELHREVYRPWGKYDSSIMVIVIKSSALHGQSRRQIKCADASAPGRALGVVSGSAKVTNGGETFLLSENQSTYIPVGVVYALENPGQVPLEIIEIQSGSYLGEDDIVRFEDRYGRVDN